LNDGAIALVCNVAVIVNNNVMNIEIVFIVFVRAGDSFAQHRQEPTPNREIRRGQAE
jgi:hypothetical protein